MAYRIRLARADWREIARLVLFGPVYSLVPSYPLQSALAASTSSKLASWGSSRLHLPRDASLAFFRMRTSVSCQSCPNESPHPTARNPGNTTLRLAHSRDRSLVLDGSQLNCISSFHLRDSSTRDTLPRPPRLLLPVRHFPVRRIRSSVP
jgi:hypothetical protein